MTEVFFVRHAQPDFSVRDDRTKPLIKDGIRDSEAVTRILSDKGIDFIVSSPYKRSKEFDTKRKGNTK